MKIPKTYMVAGALIRAREGTPCTGEDQLLMGSFSPVLNEIEIDVSLTPDIKAQTFCHEVVESWNSLLGLHLRHHTIQALGAALHQFLETK